MIGRVMSSNLGPDVVTGKVVLAIEVDHRDAVLFEGTLSRGDEVVISAPHKPSGKTYFDSLREVSSQDEKTQRQIDEAEALWKKRKEEGFYDRL